MTDKAAIQANTEPRVTQASILTGDQLAEQPMIQMGRQPTVRQSVNRPTNIVISQHFLDCLEKKKKLKGEIAALKYQIQTSMRRKNLHTYLPKNGKHSILVQFHNSNMFPVRVNAERMEVKKYKIPNDVMVKLLESSKKKTFKLSEYQLMKFFGPVRHEVIGRFSNNMVRPNLQKNVELDVF